MRLPSFIKLPNNRKFTNFIGGYINLDKGYFRDINGRWKKKIFIADLTFIQIFKMKLQPLLN